MQDFFDLFGSDDSFVFVVVATLSLMVALAVRSRVVKRRRKREERRQARQLHKDWLAASQMGSLDTPENGDKGR